MCVDLLPCVEAAGKGGVERLRGVGHKELEARRYITRYSRPVTVIRPHRRLCSVPVCVCVCARARAFVIESHRRLHSAHVCAFICARCVWVRVPHRRHRSSRKRYSKNEVVRSSAEQLLMA